MIRMPFLRSVDIGFQQANARLPTASSIVEMINQFGRKQLLYSPYIPYLTPSDVHLLAPLKQFLSRTKFLSNNEEKNTMSKWLKAQSEMSILKEYKIFFSDGKIF